MRWNRRGWLRQLLPQPPLRPPGARAERTFAALCIRCNRCVAVCPYRTLRPAGWRAGLSAGTPEVRPREIPCYLCMMCPPVCPTGALDPITDLRRVRMGVARVDEAICFAYQGIMCRTCVDECPLQDEAIVQDSELRPIVTDKCVGCGICERVCPAPAVAIHVVPAGNGNAE